MFLQETHSTKEVEGKWKQESGKGESSFSHGKSNARGVCILFKQNLDLVISKTITDNYGRLLILKAKINDNPYIFINVYAPNDEAKAVSFFENVHSIMLTEDISTDDNIVMGGDFNCALNPLLDRRSDKPFSSTKLPLIKSIQNIMETFETQDIWRIKNPTVKSYTWRHPGKFQFSRIDFWLTSNHLQDFTNDVDILYGIRSDHSAISLSINIKASQRGPGFWKLNTSLLTDKNYTESVKKLLNSLLKDKESFEDINSFWEWIKYNIRKQAMAYSKRQAFLKNMKEQKLQNDLNKAQFIFDNNPCFERKQKVETLQKEMEEIYNEKIKGMLIRSKIQWYEYGEKSSKYFLNLEKRNAVRKSMKKLLIDGSFISKPEDILKAQKCFYENVYSKKNLNNSRENLDTFVSGYNVPKLSEELQKLCEGEITVTECEAVIKTFQNGKTPGNDGIPAEFYKTFWSVLSPLLIECFNYSYGINQLPLTQTQAVITLIEKKDTDRTLLTNWRPISLLNVDRKILSKVIAFRIKKVLPELIHCNQTGYVQGRYIGESVRLIEDIMNYTVESDIPGILLTIDFEKAFDSMDWNFITESLKIFGFGPSLIKWFELLYRGSKSCVLNDGFSSQYFNVQRGVRQGDPPLSILIYHWCRTFGYNNKTKQ